MKKQKNIIWLIVLVILFFTLPQNIKAQELSAEMTAARLIDKADVLTDMEETRVVSALNKISRDNELDVVILTTSTLEGKNPTEYAEEFYDEQGYGQTEDQDGIILLVSLENNDWAMVAFGKSSIIFSEDIIYQIGEKFVSKLDENGFAEAFLNYTENINMISVYGDFIDESELDLIENPQTAEDYEKLGIPAPERLSLRLVDEADILTDAEEAELLARLDAISEEYKNDVVIVTNYSLDEKTAREYADDFFDYHGYGFGPESNGILLLLSMEYRDWAISTTGSGIKTFTDAGQNYMTENFLSYISDGNYLKGFQKFADLSEDFLEQARTGQPYDHGNMPKDPLAWYWLPITLLISLFLAFSITKKMKSKLKSVRRQEAAHDYIRMNSFDLSDQRDLFLYRNVSSAIKPKDSGRGGGGGGGSSTHTSSSGTSHGGSSGKF